jgi:NAD(P)-dependent dehydrogenase (short-subunit alcohol dehydrogenase family)
MNGSVPELETTTQRQRSQRLCREQTAGEIMTSIDGSVVLVTGANGGLGIEFVKQALERGATKVYAAARTPREWDDPRIVPLKLDVTDAASVSAAAVAAADTSIVLNNAGISSHSSMTTGDFADVRANFETNFFGALAVARDFAPVLARNGGGAIVNVLSVLSWIGLAGSYSASKAALWSATNSLRLDLAGQGTQVVGLHLGYTDTPMTKDVTAPKNDPADIVRAAYDGLEAGEYEVLADALSVQVKQGLAGSIEAMYPQLAL